MTVFSQLPLSAALQQKLAAAQFLTLTPVQEKAIPPALEGKDVIGTAQTGTGKTLAFLIPIIEMLDREPSRQALALVLLPTRELAMQVHEQYEQLRNKNMPKAALVIGGVSEKSQITGLRAGSPWVIATPGRLQDFIDRRLVDLRNVKMLVLDEADRMLDMGFLPAIRRIVSVLPIRRQTLCYSATLEQSVAGLVNDYMRNPVRVALGSVLKPAESVQLQAFEVRPGEKLDLLRQLLYAEKGQTLIFTRTKRGAQRLAKDVINYDLPKMAEDFIHRVGRTGRAGLQGRASSLVAGVEVMELRQIERTLQLRIERKQVDPSGGGLPKRIVQNTLPTRTLSALPGEVFV